MTIEEFNRRVEPYYDREVGKLRPMTMGMNSETFKALFDGMAPASETTRVVCDYGSLEIEIIDELSDGVTLIASSGYPCLDGFQGSLTN